MSDEQPQVVAEVRVPEGWAQGAYANGVNVWFCETDMTLDFVVNLTPEVATSPDGKPVVVIPQQVVARVKISPSMATYMSLQVSQAVAQYETRYGRIEQLKDQPPLIPGSLDDENGSDDV